MDQLLCKRRRVLAALALAPFASLAATDYPVRPLRWVVASPPGSGGDVIARLVATEVAKLLGQTIVIDNKPGADGNIAASAVVGAKPDGYTLLFNYTSHVTNPSLRSQPFDAIKDFTPISMLATNWTTLVVRGDSPAKSVTELVAMAKKKPGALSVGFLPGSITHLAAELLFSETGMDVLRVPYKANNDAIKDLMGGRIDFSFSTIAPIQGFLQNGTLRALAVTDPSRSELLPGVPTMAEVIPGFSATGWYGLVGPKGLPPEIVTTLNSAVRRVLSDPETRTRLLQQGSQPNPTSPQEFGAFIAREIPRWEKVIKNANIQ
ncbi:MAG TPA: tripartite tricarboxylate transporter substrate binding protein [Ramlibacter sp.]|nr:tripartite tricarboxylate transporter substrate binding protein [Ramlibacter sp.]